MLGFTLVCAQAVSRYSAASPRLLADRSIYCIATYYDEGLAKHGRGTHSMKQHGRGDSLLKLQFTVGFVSRDIDTLLPMDQNDEVAGRRK